MLLVRFRFRFSLFLGFRLEQKRNIRNLKGLDAVTANTVVLLFVFSFLYFPILL